MAKESKKIKKRIKVNLGNIIAIPLPKGKFAFAKIFKDKDLGVYDFVSDKIEDISKIVKHKFSFLDSVTSAPIKSGQWPIIGEEPFPDEDSAWAPPRAIGVIPGLEVDPRLLQITYKGVDRRATLSEAKGLDINSFSQHPELFVDEIVERLIRGKHDDYRIK